MSHDRLRFARVTRLLVSFVSLQGATQLASGLAGVLSVRVLPISSFAVYAIATSVQTSVNVLSDVGVTTVVLARAGQHHADPRRLAILAETAKQFRLRLSIPALVVGAPLLYLSLGTARPDLLSCVAILFFLSLSLLLQLSASIDGALLLALLHPNAQLIAQLLAALLRLLLIVTALALVPHYLMALAVNCVGAAIQAWVQRLALLRLLPKTRETSSHDRIAFHEFVRKQFPNAVHFAFSAQITLWLISILSSSTVVANVGALGRLTGLIVLAQSGVMTLVAPRVARLSDAKLILRRFAQALGLASGLSALGLLAAFALPGPLLWVIGPKYHGLGPYLPIAMASAVAYLLSTTFYSLNSARAWVISPLVAIPLTLGTQVLAFSMLDISNVRGALIFGLLGNIPSLMMGVFLTWRHLREMLTLRARVLTGAGP